MNKQYNRGSENKNISINELSVTIFNGLDVLATDFFNSYGRALQEYDEYIAKELGLKLIVNKTNREEKFIASKILKSLLTIGVPLDAAFIIFRSTIEKLFENRNENYKLDTKTVRKLVCEAIQTYDLKNYAPSQIQSWSQKYVRKYGRNNQVVKIQFENGSTTEISMDFLKSFVDDLIQTISPNLLLKRISNNHRNEIAECVLDFVNSCDIYIIRYGVLKNIIMEIALPPPHPWFINEDTKSSIISYDSTQLKTNLAKARRFHNDGKSVIPQSILLEIIHHASSMILAKYDYFLGCNDLSSLNLLKSLLEELINKPYEDLILDDFPINTLLADITKAKIKYDEYVLLIKKISEEVNTSAINIASFSTNVIDFGTQSLKIIENNNIYQLNNFYETNWHELRLDEIMDNIRMFMNASFGYNEIKSTSNFREHCRNYFLYRLSKFNSNALLDVKKTIFVFYGDNNLNDYNVFQNFKKAEYKTQCTIIFLIAETYEILKHIEEAVRDKLNENNCSDNYVILSLDKKALKSIYSSKNPPLSLENILFHQMLFTDSKTSSK